MSGRAEGFTLVEMLVATSIFLCVVAAIFSVTSPAQGMFAAQPEVTDMQQRLRVGVEMLQSDLLMAGAGMDRGPLAGPLGHIASSILPMRRGSSRADPPGSFFSDRLTLMYVPRTSAQTSIADVVSSASDAVRIDIRPGCPVADEACGFRAGMTVAILDGTGAWDTFNVSEVQNSVLLLRHLGGALSKTYHEGSVIVQIVTFTYWLRTDPATDTYQLMRYDGYSTDLPVADNIVGLSFEYYAEPAPPQLRPTLIASTTYGPTPPPVVTDDPSDSWGRGENCIFAVADGIQVPRLPSLGDAGLVRLPPGQLTDGPWCPDANSPGRYDADLLRVRRVGVVLRVQAGSSFRGRAGALFTRTGTTVGGERFLPDREIRFDVTPRNLNLGR